ncbi:uncharacterized protein LOC127724406 [Mytilus californianus]|uniref:uncharacterized protein LOC127724406 n=1 Tax=Mytilus californianus TaxID=6549 RepID=UPI002246FC59|nr:uncharacterized protein LOC127724406 [Mytilus californianus]
MMSLVYICKYPHLRIYCVQLRIVNLIYSLEGCRCSNPILLICLEKCEIQLTCREKVGNRYALLNGKSGSHILFNEWVPNSSIKSEQNCKDISSRRKLVVLKSFCCSNWMHTIIPCIKGVQIIGGHTTDIILKAKRSSAVPFLSAFLFDYMRCSDTASVSLLSVLLCIVKIFHLHSFIFHLSQYCCNQFFRDIEMYCSHTTDVYFKIAKQSFAFVCVFLFSIVSMEVLQILKHIVYKLFAELSGNRLLIFHFPKKQFQTINTEKDIMSLKSFLKQNIQPLKPRQTLTVFPIYGKTSNAATMRQQLDSSLIPERSTDNKGSVNAATMRQHLDSSLIPERSMDNGGTVNATTRGQQEGYTLMPEKKMESELLRLSTLCNFPVFGISLIRLAEYGFYSEGNNDELVCYSCGNRVKGWTPYSDHSDVNNHYSNCQHVRKKKFAVPLEASGCSQDFTQMGKPDGNTEQLCDEYISSDVSIMCTDDGNDAIPPNLIVSSKNEGQQNNQSRTIGQAMSTETSSEANGNEVYPYISEKYGLSRGIGYSDNAVRREFGVSINQNSESQGTGTHESSLMNGRQMFPPTYTREISVDGNTNITDSLNLLSLESEEQMPYFSGITQNPRNHLPSLSHQPMTKQNESLGSNPEQLTFKYDGRLMKMKYPNYELLQKRRDSFFDWPANRDFLHPYDLAECGFFFTHFEDCVRCFQCGIGLRNWEDNDNVWVEHARWSRKCQYLTIRKGKEFIDTVVQMLGLNTDGENMQSEPLQLEPTDITQSTRNPLEHDAAQYVLSEKIFDDVELVRVCIISLIETTGWDSITIELLVTSMLEMSATELASPNDNKATNSQSNGSKPCMDCPVETGNPTSRGTEIKSSTTESIATVVEIDQSKKAEDDPEELQKEIEKMKDLYTCKICLDEKVGVTFLPCGHLVTCSQCSPKLRRCPLCRTFIRSTIQTKI